MMKITNNTSFVIKASGESWTLVKLLNGRYGALALTRAAGQAAAAERQGDREQSALWHRVIAHLRQSIAFIQAEA